MKDFWLLQKFDMRSKRVCMISAGPLSSGNNGTDVGGVGTYPACRRNRILKAH
jgi:hypothetical protein